MALEIERKWLIALKDVPFDLQAAEKHHIVQTYVSFSPQIRLRCLDSGARHIITIKPDRTDEATLARREFEADITADSYQELSSQAIGNALEKTRYIIPEPGNTGRCFEIDVFEGAYAGLTVAEMEFACEEDAIAFPTPPWCLRDITHESAYKNVVMAQGLGAQLG